MLIVTGKCQHTKNKLVIVDKSKDMYALNIEYCHLHGDFMNINVRNTSLFNIDNWYTYDLNKY